jgi:hypothetical protein
LVSLEGSPSGVRSKAICFPRGSIKEDIRRTG